MLKSQTENYLEILHKDEEDALNIIARKPRNFKELDSELVETSPSIDNLIQPTMAHIGLNSSIFNASGELKKESTLGATGTESASSQFQL